MNSKIITSIICYNPKISKLDNVVKALYFQVEKIVIIDNGSVNSIEIKKCVKDLSKIVIIENDTNKGIAIALNQALAIASAEGYDWLLTMDQDSIVPGNLVEKYREVIEKNIDIGIVTLQIKKNKDYNVQLNDTLSDVERCITSGSLMNLAVMERIGKFDEAMFIDWVDHDICKRVRLSGYRIIRVNSIFLNHELGPQDTILISKKLRKYFGMRPIRKPYSENRTYYYVRNGIYYYRKYQKIMTKSEKKFTKYEICMSILRGLLLGKNKIAYFQSICKAIYDSKNMPILKKGR